jgi:MoxR-like ATPase
MHPAREAQGAEVASETRFDALAAFELLSADLVACRRELKGAVLGQDAAVEQALAAAVAGGHALVSGPPGTAKSRLADAVAAVLGLRQGRVRASAATAPAEVFEAPVSELEARRSRPDLGPAYRDLAVFEDLDRAPLALVAALIERMDEPDRGPRPLPRPWQVLATVGGDLRLLDAWNESWLDRFLLRIDTAAPDRESERAVLLIGERPLEIRPRLDLERLRLAQRLAVELPVGERVVQLILDLVRRCRPDEPSAPPMVRGAVLRGPGPRAGQALMRLARARALLDGRPSPSEADVRALAAPALRHRLLVYPAAGRERLTADEVVAAVLGTL